MMPHILPTLANETIGKELGDYYPVFYNVFARSAQSAKMLQKALQYSDRDDLLFTSIIDPLFSFLLLMVGSRRIFLVFMAELVMCK